MASSDLDTVLISLQHTEAGLFRRTNMRLFAVALPVLAMQVAIGTTAWPASDSKPTGTVGSNPQGAPNYAQAAAEHRVTPNLSVNRVRLARADPSHGPPIVMVFYIDLICPVCARAYPELKAEILAHPGRVDVIVKNFPIPSHSAAAPLARWLQAAQLIHPDKGADALDVIMAAHLTSSDDIEKRLKSVCAKMRLQCRRLVKLAGSDQVTRAIEDDVEEATSFGIDGTPGLVLDGRAHVGFESGDYARLLDAALENNHAQ